MIKNTSVLRVEIPENETLTDLIYDLLDLQSKVFFKGDYKISCGEVLLFSKEIKSERGKQ